MPNLLRPAVYVTEVQGASQTQTSPAQTQFVFVGPHQQGPLGPYLVTSWSIFKQVFGGFVPHGEGSTVAADYLSLSVYNFFNSGGGQCWVVRVVSDGSVEGSTAAVAASGQLKDAENAETILVQAVNPGRWGGNVSDAPTSVGIAIAVTAATNGLAGYFNIVVYYGKTTNAGIVERWTNLSMNVGDSGYFFNVINNPYTGSKYITVTDVQNATHSSTPGNEPAFISVWALNGALDGSAVADADIETAIDKCNVIAGPMVINLPGIDNTGYSGSVGAAFTFAANRPVPDTFIVVDPPNAQTVLEIAGTTDASVPGSDGYVQSLSVANPDYGAVYYPYVQISDPTSTSRSAIKFCPPGGFVLGVMDSTDRTVGPWKAPAGQRTGTIGGANGLQHICTNDELDILNVNNVNAIKYLEGAAGIAIYGARTLSQEETTLYINVRRLLMYIEASFATMFEWAIFEDNDSVLWGQISTQANAFLQGLYALGAFEGASASEAYYVVCNNTNNTPATIAAGTLVIEVGVAPVYPAEFISITVSQWANGSSSVVESVS